MNTKEEEKKDELELRMYFFVPYNISPIQQAIQAGHAAQQYDNIYKNEKLTIDFIEKHKTWIILNGGTTNSSRGFDSIPHGSMNQIGDQLIENSIRFAHFQEPDLENALTALCFIADERVFNYEDYPRFPEWIHSQEIEVHTKSFIDRAFISPITSDEDCQRILPEYYEKWIEEMLGGEKNLFLRNLLKGKKLA